MKTQCLKNLLLSAVLLAFTVVTTMPVRATGADISLAHLTINSSPAQGLSAAQIEAAVEEYFASASSRDVQRFVNNFASDGVLEDPVGTPPAQGAQAIAAFYGNIVAPFSEIKPKIQEITVCGDEAAVNWKLKLTTMTGKHMTLDGMGVFSFNQAGKLQSVREFWDLTAFLEQLQS
jgi:steroid delta-isomerase